MGVMGPEFYRLAAPGERLVDTVPGSKDAKVVGGLGHWGIGLEGPLEILLRTFGIMLLGLKKAHVEVCRRVAGALFSALCRSPSALLLSPVCAWAIDSFTMAGTARGSSFKAVS
jgi:hypothetical protein